LPSELGTNQPRPKNAAITRNRLEGNLPPVKFRQPLSQRQNPKLDFSSVWGKFDRIGEQVDQYLPHPLFVEPHRAVAGNPLPGTEPA